MKVLFVSSWNKTGGISPTIKSQGDSLAQKGIEIEYYGIKGKGLKGYIKNISPLRLFLKKNAFNIVHSHYSLTGFIATLAGAKKTVVSLMGSDVKKTKRHNIIIKLFNFFFWKKCIVKSEDLKISSGLKKAFVIPNGVSLNKYIRVDKNKAMKKTGWDRNKKHILFAANPNRIEKNFKLAKRAFSLIANESVELQHLDNISNKDMSCYYSAADVILLTSLWEGSPNVIKEAMACNCPIVSTNVGDVKWLLGNEAGHFISNFNSEDVSQKIKQALAFSKKQRITKGRKRIIDLGIDSETIAMKIIEVYENITA